jgi:hypothetical protein
VHHLYHLERRAHRRWQLHWRLSAGPSLQVCASPWTDEHLNPVPPKEQFELPEVEGGQSKWRWVQGSEWKVEGVEKDTKVEKGASKEDYAWIYYDNKVRVVLSYTLLILIPNSGGTDEEAKMAGDVTPGVGNGIATLNLSKRLPPQTQPLCPRLNPAQSILLETLTLITSRSSPPISA